MWNETELVDAQKDQVEDVRVGEREEKERREQDGMPRRKQSRGPEGRG